MAENRENDLILAPNEFAFISDTQSGNISVIVGPNKKSLAGTDQLMLFNTQDKIFERCNMKQAIQIFPFADNRSYMELHNPASDDQVAHPKPEKSNMRVDLAFGDKINLKGPCTFALWPGQVARVIQGHQLRSNQYLLVQVYNERAARENWQKGVMKSADKLGEETLRENPIPSLSTGKLLVIKGTEVSFFIPPTGIQVFTDAQGQFVRDAVTIERLQYCILLDENGEKRYVRGPAVVFPSPTETFVSKNGRKIFNAIELNENMGLYIKVIAEHPNPETGEIIPAGQELFLTGSDQKIYFPRTEHALIKYGEDPVHYAVAIPKGEARYVLDKLTGEISMQLGPCMFLPDPRKKVLVRRILNEKQVRFWYPGNEEALAYNRGLQMIEKETGTPFILDSKLGKKGVVGSSGEKGLLEMETLSGGDELARKTTFTPPRILTLNTKYEGAVNINVWPGYAVQLVSNTGEREVVVGPKSILLEYDQVLDTMELATGTPKSDANLLKTAFLRVKNNRISDVIDLVTKDLVNAKVRVTYRVNFEGEPQKWFEVENYVLFLVDHCRSLVRNVSKKFGIEEFNDRYVDIIRDCVLGGSGEEGRIGRKFSENGMRIYDLEVLQLNIGDGEIAKLVQEAQHNAVSLVIKVAKEEKRVEATKKIEELKQQLLSSENETVLKGISLQIQEETLRDEQIGNSLKFILTRQDEKNQISRSFLDRRQWRIDQKIAFKKARLRLETESYREKMEALQPGLIEALTSSGEMELARVLAENLPKASGNLGGLFGPGGMDQLLDMVRGSRIERGIIKGEGSQQKKRSDKTSEIPPA